MSFLAVAGEAQCCRRRDKMVAALLQGRTLVVDRYAYSGAVFTAAKRVPGLDLEWCKVRAHGVLLAKGAMWVLRSAMLRHEGHDSMSCMAYSSIPVADVDHQCCLKYITMTVPWLRRRLTEACQRQTW